MEGRRPGGPVPVGERGEEPRHLERQAGLLDRLTTYRVEDRLAVMDAARRESERPARIEVLDREQQLSGGTPHDHADLGDAVRCSDRIERDIVERDLAYERLPVSLAECGDLLAHVRREPAPLRREWTAVHLGDRRAAARRGDRSARLRP